MFKSRAAPVSRRNIVVIGQTQSGKTTLIRRLLHFCLDKNVEFDRAGGGFLSDTKVVTHHSFAWRKIRVNPLHRNSSPEVGLTHSARMDEACDSPKYKSNWKPVDPAFEITLLDTPGLDDSNLGASDEDHQYNILKELVLCKSVTAFVFVINSRSPFTGGFQRIFRQYWDAFKDFRTRFIVVHTYFDPLDEDYEPRQKECLRAFRKTFPETANIDMPHVFIDSMWGKSKRGFPEVKAAMAAESVNQLRMFVETRDSTSVDQITYRKTQRMMELDKQVMSHVQGLAAGLQETLDIEDEKQGEIFREMAELSRSIENLNSTIDGLERKIRAHDTLEAVSVVEKRVPDFPHELSWADRFQRWLSSQDDTVYLESPCAIHSLRTSTASTWSKWVDKEISDCQATATLRTRNFALHEGTIVALVLKKDLHKASIDAWQTDLTIAVRRRTTLQQKEKEKQNDYSASQEQWRRYADKSVSYAKVEALMKDPDLTLDTYIKMKSFYTFNVAKPRNAPEMFSTVLGLLPLIARPAT
eukprot:TRINITY_DN22377_c0_g1_i1.p1 TRINITY_DN22377_c0_g1~~TRINITY_DN22377_c0_g1_i1.p1  ORF type:complete len:527 (+),score=95.35 TRINITY_DN22377_c0_g1_i1:174-1754(+)